MDSPQPGLESPRAACPVARPVALVTGAGGRVGRAIAVELAAAGARVVVHYARSEEGARETARLARAAGGEAVLAHADLATAAGCAALAALTAEVCAEARAEGGGLSALVHNASRFAPAPLDALTPEAWAEMLQVNLTAPYLLTRALLPALRAARGLVLTLCDISAERPLRGYAHYTASKAGLVGLTRALAVELAPDVRCLGVSPGQVAWPPDMPAEERERLARRIPLGRGGAPEDVARLARFLWREAPYMTGAVIPVDGGLSCRY
ncbi:MAG: SDR family oxidoreductase [Deltaproteobacteria bacterium]|nr:SDR family oxidoreductase [Deltaproteobacteria bacterium]